jgi:hypothetical protein
LITLKEVKKTVSTLQNHTKYEPTEKEKTLLEVLINPEYRMKSITDICKIAKCARSTYYEAFSKPEFVEIYRQYSVDLVKQFIAPIINAFIREAQRGSFQHGKVILEMAGMYSDKLEITGKINNPMEGLTTEELKKLIQDD